MILFLKQLLIAIKLLVFSNKKELRAKSNFIAIVLSKIRLHFLYERFIKYCDPKIEFEFNNCKKKFVGSGYGIHSLNVFRKIFSNFSEPLFEKIYFNNTISLKNTILINEIFKEIQIPDFKVPKIKKTIQGEFYTIVYFDYYVLERFRNEDDLFGFNNNIIRFLNKFENSISINFKIEINQIDIAKEDMISRRIERILLINKIYSEPIYSIINLIKRQSYGLIHGDLNYKNVFKGVVIDWEKFGMAPFGYEYGMNLAFNKLSLIKNVINLSVVKNQVEKYYGEESHLVQLNIIFFAIIFSSYAYSYQNKIDENQINFHDLFDLKKSYEAYELNENKSDE